MSKFLSEGDEGVKVAVDSQNNKMDSLEIKVNLVEQSREGAGEKTCGY